MRYWNTLVRRLSLIGSFSIGFLLVSCGLLDRAAPLPTIVPTAALPLAEVPTSTGLAVLPPTRTSEPSPTALILPASATVTLDRTATEETALTADAGNLVPTNTATPTPLLSPSPSPTHMPSSTPTTTLPSPTPSGPPSATPRPTPIPPDSYWPAATPHSLPVAGEPRHGVAAALGAGDGFYSPAPYGWTYGYSAFVPPGPVDVQHVPMLVGSPRNGLPEFDIIVDMDNRQPNNWWLVFNECENHRQCNTTPQEAARFYHEQVVEVLYNQGADSDARLIVGGVNAHACGIQWLEQFFTTYEATYGPLPRAGWHFHIYPEIQPSGWPASGCGGSWNYDDSLFPDPLAAFDLWQEHANNALAFVQQYGRPDDEIWFTEIGCLNYGYHQEQRPVCQADGFMNSYAANILNWLNTEGRWVNRYAWFTNWDYQYWDVTKLLASVEGPWQYSSLGWYFRQIAPASAVPIPWP